MAQRGLPDTKSEFASFGTQIHAAFEGQRPDLTAEQWDILESAIAVENAVLESLGAVPDPSEWPLFREGRLWAIENEGGKPLCSGQADAMWIHRQPNAGSVDHVIIEDLKSLFGDVQEASSNMQLRDLAALVWESYGALKVTAFINQPLVTRKPELVVYELDDLKRAHTEMIARVKRSMTPGQPRTPGERQCKYCKAATAGTCPEFLQWADQGLSIIAPTPDVSMIQPEKLAMAWMRWKEVAPFFTKIEDTLKAMPIETLNELGLTMKPGANVRSVTDAEKAKRLLIDHRLLTEQEIWDVVSMPIGKVEQKVQESLLLTSKKAKEKVEAVLSTVIQEKQNKPSLSKLKPE